jgi:ubiquinone/menaquinone biosynthesis C-methylase UbiE
MRRSIRHRPSFVLHHNAVMRPHPLKVARWLLPPALLATAVRPGAGPRQRIVAGSALLGLWTAAYARYRQRSKVITAREWELLRTANLETFSRHYNECVPTLEEELDLWGEYHAHRHQMRYDLVAEMTRTHVPWGGSILDVGCGAALVADKLGDLPLTYVGLDYGGHHIEFAADKLRSGPPLTIRRMFVRGDGEHLPFRDAQFDVVVMSEVIEHLMRPELAVWEIARVLKPSGVLVLTTNNASEMPLRSPLSDPFSWLEKALGFHQDKIISHRPWVWPWPVDRSILPEDAPNVYVPHTWHKQAETTRMFAAAGMETIHASSFEFPPPQSQSARWLNDHGEAGKRIVDVVEAVCQRTPLINRLGCHVFMVARKTSGGLPQPPPGIWPGPFSEQPSEHDTAIPG